ncbi:MAG: glyoxalase superfamily protein [Rhizobiaceae bacterium]
MNEYLPLPSLENLKQQAKRLRSQLSVDAKPVSHSQALELLAHQYGYKNWNVLHAACGNQPPGPPVTLGTQVSGRYLGQAFTGEVIAVAALSQPDQFRITVNFEKPVDVIKFDGWSAMRRRVSSQISRQGQSPQRTSDGAPIMELDLH